MKNENFDDIKALFGEKTELPDSLSKENTVKKLGIVTQKKKSNIKPLKRIVAAAAAFAVVAVGSFAVLGRDRMVRTKEVPIASDVQQAPQGSITYAPIDLGLKQNKMTKFSSDEDLKNYFHNIAKQYSVGTFGYLINGAASVDYDIAAAADVTNKAPTMAAAEQVPTTASAAAMSPETTDTSSSSFGETNIQVSGVDEADIIKNDGRYLYIVSSETLLTIIDTQTMEAVYSEKLEPNKKDSFLSICNIYLNKNTLVAVCNESEKADENIVFDGLYSTGCYGYMPNGKTVNIIFDISDRSKPKELRRFSQDGYISDTRMVGSVLYTVTNYQVNVYEKNKEEYVPTVDGKKADVNDIYIINKDNKSTSYIILSAFDTADVTSDVNSVFILGNSDIIHCTDSRMFILENTYTDEKDIVNIYAFALDGNNVTYKASGVVPGYTYEQYFVDYYNSYLRIATNNYDYNSDKDISSLYALDSEMRVVGKLEDIADDEQIKSVRFMGDTAYVVTFKNTDPLFAIDLSDLSSMKILGEVKLPGFSEYLHGVGDGLLVGIGYDGDEENANFETVKLTLFDVSDPLNPKELDTHVIKNASTTVTSDPKAFFFYPEENIIGIPLCYYNTEPINKYTNESHQFKLMKIENGKFVDKQNYAHLETQHYSSLFRGTYIGQKLYTINAFSVCEFEIGNSEMLRKVEYATFESYGNEDDVEVTSPVVINGAIVKAPTATTAAPEVQMTSAPNVVY